MKKIFTTVSRIFFTILLSFVIFTVIGFVLPNRALAGCTTAALCDAAPGACSTTCNGGSSCQIADSSACNTCSPSCSPAGCCKQTTWPSCCTPAGGGGGSGGGGSGGSGGGGGYGACGNCSGCPGTNQGQCRTDPGGACVWDPSGCGGGGGTSINMCDLFKISPSAVVAVGQTSSNLQILVKQGTYSHITITNPNPAVAVATPAWWASAGKPDLGQNYTTESKLFTVKGLKAGAVLMTANQFATYPGYEMLYCTAQTAITVTATAALPPTASITATPTTISGPSAVTVAWSSTNATSCIASGGWSGAKALSGSILISGVNATSTYTIRCVNIAGTPVTVSDTVTFVAAPPVAPTLTFTATPTTVPNNGSTTLTWSTTNATTCTASNAWAGAKAVSGSLVVAAITANKTFVLTCTGAGGSVSKTVNVNLAAAPPLPVVNLTAAPANVLSGSSTTLTWTTTNATTCTASNAWVGAKATSGSLAVANVTTPKTFVLTCTGPGGSSSDTVSVTIQAAGAPTTSITASPSSIASSTSITVAWSSTNATSCTASGGWSGAKALSGSTSVAGVATTTTFTIKCLNAAGTVSTSSATVTLTPPAAPTITFTATPASIAVPSTITLTWTTTNAASCTSSGGWIGARPVSGTISVPGVSATTVFTLTCVSASGVSTSASRTVTFTAPPPVACGKPNPQDPASTFCAPCPGCATAVDWDWQAIANANGYFFEVRDQLGAVVIPKALRTAASLGCLGGGTCTAQVSLTPGKSYRAFVSSHSSAGACTPDSVTAQTNLFLLDVCTTTISSDVNEDLGGAAKRVGGACTLAGAPSAYTGGGSVDVTDGGPTYSGAVNGSGQFSVSGVPNGNNYSVTLKLPAGSPYFCTCPLGCTYNGKTVPLSPNLVFYTSPIVENWFQTVGGEVSALASGGTSVNDPIPASFCASTGCDPYLSGELVNGKPETAGALFTTRGATSADLKSDPGFQNDNVSTASHYIQTSVAPVLKESYDYFYRLTGTGINPADDFAGASAGNAQKPNCAGGCKTSYFHAGDLTVDTNWNVPNNEKIIVFVTGNLTINKNITLAKGGFVGFIVKGNITITSAVGTGNFAQTNNGQVQGMYFADGTLTVASTGAAGSELKFIGEGTFAARNGVSLPRDFRNGGNGIQNNSGPASLMIYRPDLIQSVPDKMKVPNFSWQETTP